MYMNKKLSNNPYKDINRKLEVLTDWFHANKLPLNVSNTNYIIIFYIPSCSKARNTLTLLFLYDKIIRPTRCIIFRWLYVAKRLDWQEHIIHAEQTLIIAMYAINKVNLFFPVAFLKKLTTL